MNWRKAIAELLYPYEFQSNRHLQRQVLEQGDVLASYEEQMRLLSEQLAGLQADLDESKERESYSDKDASPAVLIPVPKGVHKPSEKDKPSPTSTLGRGVATQIAKNMAALSGGEISFVANTNSMEPVLDANCVIVLQPAQPHQIQVGDIISYNGNASRHKHYRGNNILHRVIDSRDGMWLLKGDNNYNDDGWIRHKHLLGRYIGHVVYKHNRKGD